MKKFLCMFFVSGLLMTGSSNAVLINEFLANPPGSDPATQDVELSGPAGSSFDLWLISVESDGFNGTVDRSTNVTGMFMGNGLAVVNIPDLENPSFTLALIENPVADPIGLDLDPLDDGTLDTSTLGTLLDAIGVPDNSGDQAATDAYSAQLNGVSLTHNGGEPENTFRDGATGDWYAFWPFGDGMTDLGGNPVNAGGFDKDPTVTTFGEVNPIFVPEPSALGLLILALPFFLRRRS